MRVSDDVFIEPRIKRGRWRARQRCRLNRLGHSHGVGFAGDASEKCHSAEAVRDRLGAGASWRPSRLGWA